MIRNPIQSCMFLMIIGGLFFNTYLVFLKLLIDYYKMITN